MPEVTVITYAELQASYDADALAVTAELPHEPWCPQDDDADLFDHCFQHRYETASSAVTTLRTLGRLKGPRP